VEIRPDERKGNHHGRVKYPEPTFHTGKVSGSAASRASGRPSMLAVRRLHGFRLHR
jgi:hypothetical protein